jgi:prepilin peptidase CpaA
MTLPDSAVDLSTPWGPWACATALFVIGVLLTSGVITDLRERRIPNTLVALGAASATLQQGLLPMGLHPASLTHPGTPGLLSGALAALLMVALAGLLWRVGLWGAGDAKWLTVLAAHTGPALVIPTLMLTAMAGGLLALWWKARRHRSPMPYAVAIAGGELSLMAALAFAAPPT